MARLVIAFLAFGAVSVLLQAWGGAYVSEFTGYPDEPVHYVTGLMVRDYLATFPWRPPMPFAEEFYNHYPTVGIGHWPPVFYVVQAAWTLIFGVSRTAVLLLIAVISAATATVLFNGWRERFGTVAAGALGLAFLATPLVQQYSRMVMAEMLLALFVMLAVFAYRRYLETTRWSDALQFGLFSAVAILTKANGLALALLPICAVLAARRFELLTRFSFWLPAVVVLAFCGPWYAFTADLAREGWSASYSPSWLLRQPAWQNAVFLVRVAGPVVFVLALVGILWELFPGRSQKVKTDSAVMAALLISVWLFHSFVAPVREARHLIPAIPALLTFAAWAVVSLAGSIGAAPGMQRSLVVLLACVTMGVSVVAGIRDHKPRAGVEPAVHQVLLQSNVSEPVLVSSETFGEAIFIAELAGRERRLGHRVIRASKVLSSSNWNGSDYRLLHRTTEAVDEQLAAMHVNVVVLDTASGGAVQVPHHRLILDVMRNGNRWRRLDAQPPHARFQVFQAITAR